MPRTAGRPVEIEYEPFGYADDPLLILVPDLGGQMIAYDAELCQGFVDRGFHVIRMDNRDSGLSTIMSNGDTYDIVDMGEDVIAVLDDVGADRAVVLGFGLGAMIAQSVALDHPERTVGLVSVGSTTGEPDVGQPTDDARALLTETEASDVTAVVERALDRYRVWSSPAWRDETQARSLAETSYRRAHHPAGTARQLAALARHRPRLSELETLEVATLIVHGDLDPVVDISGGRRTADLIAGSEFLEIEGMAHDLALQMWPQLISAVTTMSGRIEW